MAEKIYFDHLTATPPSPEALQAALPFYETYFASPLSPHQMGQEVVSHVKEAEKPFREFFGATSEDQFVFTASGAEAIQQVVHTGLQEQFKKHGKNHFVARAIDDASIILPLSNLESEGCFLRLASCQKRGFVTKDALIDAISARTAMVSLTLASALTGVLQPLDEIAEVCKERAIWLHVDATHALGKLPVNFSELACDYLTFDGIGLQAPLGTGGLFAKKGRPLHPLILASPFNVPAFMALAYAAQMTQECQSLYCTEVARLRSVLELGIQEAYKPAVVLFVDEERLPHVTTVAFQGIPSELLAFSLSRKGVYTCIGGGQLQQLEQALSACGIELSLARSAITFCLSKETQENEIERAIAIIGDATKRLSKVSRSFL